MGRNILLVTADQQRFDALGCNGGVVARTPAADALAASGLRFTRAHTQSVVCMPSRSTMLTGQYPSTHGVWMNGVPLPEDAPSVARHLSERAGYRCALFGKAHFEPFLDFGLRFYENRMATVGEHGPHRGFEHLALAVHGPLGPWHYSKWLQSTAPGSLGGFCPSLDGELRVFGGTGGDTGAVQVRSNPVAREHYHTDWVAARTVEWLDGLSDDEDWFVWMSFPDPHHPWDPPASEVSRVPWRDLAAPAGYAAARGRFREVLERKPHHWLRWFTGELMTNYEAPPTFAAERMTEENLREIDALIHVKNELIDEALGRVLARLAERGWLSRTDVFYTADHGEMQGDFGLLFKGACHVDALLRVPLLWKPAVTAGVDAATIDAPVGLVDLAPTFCAIAGVEAPAWMEGRPLPQTAEAARSERERVITEWDSEYQGTSLHLRTIHRDGLTCTVYEKSSLYDGTEGELYDHSTDPWQHENLWDDPARRSLRNELVADLRSHLPAAPAARRPVVANV